MFTYYFLLSNQSKSVRTSDSPELCGFSRPLPRRARRFSTVLQADKISFCSESASPTRTMSSNRRVSAVFVNFIVKDSGI